MAGLFAMALAAGCGGSSTDSAKPAPTATPGAPATPFPHDAAVGATETAYDAHGLVALVDKPYTGDFDGMVQRRQIRILTPYSRTHYFIDLGTPRGIAYDAGMKLEEDINKRLKTGLANKIHVTFIATSRDELYNALVAGRGDIVAVPVTITPERAKLVEFTEPTRKASVNEILVSAPGTPVLAGTDALSGKTVGVRGKSIYEESLAQLNASFKQRGLAPVTIKQLPGALEDEDILEMVNAGLVPATIVNDYLAEFWKKVLPDLVISPNVHTRDAASTAWAVRKNSPKLLAVLNPLIKTNTVGSAFGNTVTAKYLKNVKYVKNATSQAEIAKFRKMVEIFRKYGQTYDMDFLLMMAQGYQESRLDNSAKSQVGAIGVMQVMPATGKELAVGDIKREENNIHAGVKYMRKVVDTYFKDDAMTPLNKTLMAFASYNAGPNRIKTLRQETAKRGLDPNVWFNNVERVVAEKIGRETVTYVGNIYKYYIAYTLVVEELKERDAGKKNIGG